MDLSTVACFLRPLTLDTLLHLGFLQLSLLSGVVLPTTNLLQPYDPALITAFCSAVLTVYIKTSAL